MSDVLDPRCLRHLSTFNEVAVILSSLIVVGSFFWFPLLLYYVITRICKTRRQRLFVCIVALALIYIPVRERKMLRKGWLWDAWQEYCSTSVVFEAPLPETHVIFAMCPHGIYPFGSALALVGKLADAFKNMKPVVADIAFRAPIFRHLLGWMGAVGASRNSMKKALREGKSLCLLPGGIAEIFLSTAEKDIVMLKKRTGFVRLALQEGTPIVPVYVFGNNRMLRLAPFMRLLDWISRKIRASLVFFYGRFGLPIPFRVPLFYAVGSAIKVPKTANPSPEQVAHFHQLVVEGIKRLHSNYQHLYQSARVLRIV